MAKKRDPIREEVALLRRKQILDAATQVFAEKGFHGATIRHIARKARLADGTIYLYFKNKTDLLLGILNCLNESERRAEDLQPGLADDVDARQFLTAYVRHRLSVIDENLRPFQAVLPDLLQNARLRRRYLRDVLEPSFAFAQPLLERWIERGVIRPGNVALMLRVVPGMVLGLLVLRMLGDPAIESSWADLPELVAGIFFEGLGAPARARHR